MAEGISIELAGHYLKKFLGEDVSGLGSLSALDTSYYIGLSSANPPTTGDFTGIEFNVAHGYSRFEVTNLLAPGLWTVTDREIVNTQVILFGPCITTPWPEVRGVGIFASETATTALLFGHLETGIGTPVGHYLKFNPGSLKIQMSQDVQRKSISLARLQLQTLQNQSYSFPGNDAYVGLGTRLRGDGTIEEFQTLTSGNMTYAPGYARGLINLSTASFSDPTGVRQTTNQVEIEFEDATDHWPSAKAFGIYTAPTGGECWYANSLSSDALVRKGDNIIVLIDKLIIKE